jgi:hypothetical protein
MAQPTIIVGPAVIGIPNGGETLYIYTEGNITERLVRETSPKTMSMVGEWDRTLVSQMVTLEFTPTGVLANAASIFPYSPSQIGTNILSADSSVIIWTKAGKVRTYGRGCITKMPDIACAVDKDWIQGTMQITCLHGLTKVLTDTDAWVAVTSDAFDDASFDETKVKRGAYTGAWGAIATGIVSETGFVFSPSVNIAMKKADGWGNVGIILTGLGLTCKFIPVGWSEENFDTYLRLQDSTAIVPGMSIGTGTGTNLVVTSAATGLTITGNHMGPAEGGQQYGLDAMRGGEVSFVSRMKWTTGAVQPLLTIAIA